MGSADFFAPGQWNFICALCGRKEKSGNGEKTWDNQWVCQRHKEVRNPQDFVRGVRDPQSLPWTRPEPSTNAATWPTLTASGAIPAVITSPTSYNVQGVLTLTLPAAPTLGQALQFNNIGTGSVTFPAAGGFVGFVLTPATLVQFTAIQLTPLVVDWSKTA